MLQRDIFAFCISLKPLERKALGELSTVRHIAAGETIYSAGDVSDALYIISRGSVEIVQENPSHRVVGSYLTRGDIFGDLEVLSDLPRTHLVRSCDSVSLQAFAKRDFAELERRVPGFFRYLCERLATRLLQAADLGVSSSHCRELSGRLSQFDLVTIYQTITNSSQTGELSIRDERGKTQAAFWFESGQPKSGYFRHLTGEEALTQLFLETGLRGAFCFESDATQKADSGEQPLITRNPEEMLISALQSRDEMQELKTALPEATVMLRRAKSRLVLEEIRADVRSIAQMLWNPALFRTLSLESICRDSDLCEAKIYAAVAELLRTGHFEVKPQLPAQKVA